MGVKKFAGIAREGFVVARRFATDSAFRAAVRQQLGRAPAVRPHPVRSTPYAGLVASSTALSDIQLAPRARQVNVVVGGVGEGRVFAGVDTALRAAVLLASRLGVSLRVVTTDPSGDATPAQETLRARYGVSDLTLVTPALLGATTFAPDDVWMATHFLTAHAVQVACDLGLIEAGNVVYLIQDYEPGFVPWSTEYAVAQSTYHAGFTHLVNSVPVARYLKDTEGISTPTSQIFAPALDLTRLARVAEARHTSSTVRIGFYGRPSKHRNLFRLGVASLRLAAERLGSDRDVTFVSVGERHRGVELAAGHSMPSRGTLSWDGYFDFLAEVDVLLSLQMSPHPSHPPLEAAISGAWAVTNDVGDERSRLHPRLLAVPARVEALAEAIVVAADRPAGPFLPPDFTLLGGDFPTAIDAVAARLSRRS